MLIHDRHRGAVVDQETGYVVEDIVIASGTGRKGGDPVGARTARLHDWGIGSVPIPTNGDRTIIRAFQVLGRAIPVLGIPRSVADTCYMVARRAVSMWIPRGIPIEAVAGAVIHQVAMHRGVHIDMERLAEILGVDRRKIHLAIKRLAFSGAFNELKRGGAPSMAKTSAIRIASSLGLPEEVVMLASRIIDAIVEKRPSLAHGRKPEVVAGSALYIASILLNRRTTRRKVAEVAGTSEAMIGARYKKILENISIEVLI